NKRTWTHLAESPVPLFGGGGGGGGGPGWGGGARWGPGEFQVFREGPRCAQVTPRFPGVHGGSQVTPRCAQVSSSCAQVSSRRVPGVPRCGQVSSRCSGSVQGGFQVCPGDSQVSRCSGSVQGGFQVCPSEFQEFREGPRRVPGVPRCGQVSSRSSGRVQGGFQLCLSVVKLPIPPTWGRGKNPAGEGGWAPPGELGVSPDVPSCAQLCQVCPGVPRCISGAPQVPPGVFRVYLRYPQVYLRCPQVCPRCTQVYPRCISGAPLTARVSPHAEFPDLVVDEDEEAEGHRHQPPLEPGGGRGAHLGRCAPGVRQVCPGVPQVCPRCA
ncbi:hypothetical protein DV515_00019833, partial [Chloebia gouldiae]